MPKRANSPVGRVRERDGRARKMTFAGLNIGEVEAFTFPGEDDIGRATTFSNSYGDDLKENNGYGSGPNDPSFPDDVITRRQVQVKATIKRALARLSSVSDYPKKKIHLDPALAFLVHIR